MLADFEKAFFRTEKVKTEQKAFVKNHYKERLGDYIEQGFSEEKSKDKIENEIKEFSERGYFS